MNHDQDDETELPATPPMPDAYAVLASILTLVSDPKSFGAKLRSLQKQEAASARAAASAVEAEAECARLRVECDAYCAGERAKVAEAVAADEARKDDLESREAALVEREQRITALEKKWRFHFETDPLVFSGMRSPEHGDPLSQFQKAYGIDPSIDSDEPAVERRVLSRSVDGVEFPENTSIVADRAERVRPGRSPRAGASADQ